MSVGSFLKVVPFADTNNGYTPQQLTTAYSVNKIPGKLGLGTTVAVIVAYNYVNLQSDFNFFCTTFNLPPLTLEIVPIGTVSDSTSWAIETCNDTQMVHSISPYAHIVVVEAASQTNQDIFAAVQYAANRQDIDCISMSFGSKEFQLEINYEHIFNVSGKCFFGASGDSYSTPIFPAISQNVCAVGGTSLLLKPDNTRLIETCWFVTGTTGKGSGSGCGSSRYIKKPNSQKNIPCVTRFSPDISVLSNPGVQVYCSFISSSLIQISGTSVSCPILTGIISIAFQKRRQLGKSNLSTANGQSNNMLNYLYSIIYPSTYYNSVFYDILQDTNGPYKCKVGYDAAGLGSVNANSLVSALTNV